MKNFLIRTLPFAVRAVPLLIGIFFINLPFSLDKNSKHLKEVGIETEAIIANGKNDDYGTTKIRFKVNGKTYTHYAPGLGRSNGGEVVSIVYDPENPDNAMVNLDYYDRTRLIIMFLFGVLFTIIGLHALYSITFGPTSKKIKGQKVTA